MGWIGESIRYDGVSEGKDALWNFPSLKCFWLLCRLEKRLCWLSLDDCLCFAFA
jgi:hypothetical protein